MNTKSKQRGVVLIEVVIASSILVIIASGLVAANIVYIKTASFTLSSTKATLLAQEGVEAVKYIRTSGWDTSVGALSTGSKHYLSFATSTFWTTTTTEEIFDEKFYRSFVVEDVLRDVNDDIASSGTLDPNTKKLTVGVSWFGNTGTTTKEIETYITNFLE